MPSRTTRPASLAAAPPPGWGPQLLVRMRTLFWLKTLGICAFMWVFFVAYFHLLRHPASPPVTMPLTAIDHAVPFTPWALAPYVSLWLYVGIPPGLMLSLRELLVYGAWAAALCLVGLGCFYLWPTAVPPMTASIDLAAHPAYAVLQGVDAAGNACPSLHVATATFTALWVQRLLGGVRAPALLHAMNWVWLLLIVWSTLATKQHVAWDALAGAMLGTLFALASLPRRRTPAG